MDSSSCSDKFPFSAIIQASDLEFYDGWLGLAAEDGLYQIITDSTDRLYMNYLMRQKVISEKRVSFYIPSYGLPIYTDFGPFNPNAIREGENFVKIPITGQGPFYGYWVAEVNAYRFLTGSKSIYSFEPR
jgi:hypothetical protein